MIETGFKEAAGAYHYSSGHHCYINREDAFHAYSNDSEFRKLIDSGLFRYVDGYYVIDDSDYIECDDSGIYSLTDYAWAKRFKALRKVRPFVKRIVGLTGTPCSNGLMDLWAQFRLLDKGERLGKRIGQYRDAYFIPDWNGFTYSPRPGAEKQIYSKIADISISMKTTDHLKMPELVMTADTVELDEAAATVYKDMEQEMCLDFTRDSITAANAGVLCGKLTQLASGSVYTDGGSVMRIHSHKLDALEDLIEAQNGKPVLIAYWYKHERDSIMERFECREIKTDADIADWNNGKIPVALIQPSSAGHGLNLQSGGSTIIWYTMPWSLELYQQTNARLWRQGQQSETVVIHHLVAAGTIDEDIMKVLENKDKTQAAMMKAVKARVK